MHHHPFIHQNGHIHQNHQMHQNHQIQQHHQMLQKHQIHQNTWFARFKIPCPVLSLFIFSVFIAELSRVYCCLVHKQKPLLFLKIWLFLVDIYPPRYLAITSLTDVCSCFYNKQSKERGESMDTVGPTTNWKSTICEHQYSPTRPPAEIKYHPKKSLSKRKAKYLQYGIGCQGNIINSFVSQPDGSKTSSLSLNKLS